MLLCVTQVQELSLRLTPTEPKLTIAAVSCRVTQGVLYTHRSNYLHALITVAPDMLALGAGAQQCAAGRQTC